MHIAESRRLALFESARTSWGDDTAQTLMDLLPPDPNALATKADLALTRSDLKLEMAGLRTEIAGVRGDLLERMNEQTRTLVLALVTIEITIVLAVVGAAISAFVLR